jgi:hypothetical protein
MEDDRVTANGKPVSENFKTWFGESKVVDTTGAPLVAYHSTNDVFDAFDQEKTMDTAFWFTANKEAALSREVGASGSKHLMPVYLRACKLAGWDEYDRLTYDQLISEGFDGVKLDDNFIVFDAKAIKSADKNSGLYDPTSPSLSDAEQAHDLGLAALSNKIISDEPNRPKRAARSIMPMWVQYMIDACTANEAGFHFEEGGCYAMAKALHEDLSKIEPLARIALNPDFGHAVVMMGPQGVDHQGDLTIEQSKSYTKSIDVSDIEKEALAAGHSIDGFDADVDWARRVIKTAKVMSIEGENMLGYPVLLKDAAEIAQHLFETTPENENMNMEFIQECMWGKQGILVRIPTDQAKADERNTDNHMAVEGRDELYAKMPSMTRPPILLNEEGLIQDGHHRKRAAQKRRDTYMLAYQLLDDRVDLGLSMDAMHHKP